jgi:hypothetical protein
VQESSQNLTNPSHVVPIVILGTDAMLAALPATPVQLAHACLRAGFANVIPASWGDELIAAAILRRLSVEKGPAIQCTCPKVAHRLLSAGSDLRPVMVPLVSPPVAVARYVQSLAKPTIARITYVGSCPGAVDDSIDIRMSPEALLAMLAEREIVPQEEPRVFEGVIPPDRRRFRSQPGGLPTVDALWNEPNPRTLVEIEGGDISTEIAQHLLNGSPVLIDVSARLGCVCAGALSGVNAKEARTHVVAHEPPRATSPVVNELEPIDLDLVVPAATRAPVDVVPEIDSTPRHSPTEGVRESDVAPPLPAVANEPTPPPPASDVPSAPATNVLSPTPIVPPVAPQPAPAVSPPPIALPSPPHSPPPPRASPTRVVPTLEDPRSGRQCSGASPPRPVTGSIPVARGVVGRALPRAYIARRRSPPRSVDTVPPPAEPPVSPSLPVDEPPPPVVEFFEKPAPVALELPEPTRELMSDSSPPDYSYPEPARVSFPAPSRRAMWLIALLIVAIIAGVGVGVFVARSLGVGQPPAAAPP